MVLHGEQFHRERDGGRERLHIERHLVRQILGDRAAVTAANVEDVLVNNDRRYMAGEHDNCVSGPLVLRHDYLQQTRPTTYGLYINLAGRATDRLEHGFRIPSLLPDRHVHDPGDADGRLLHRNGSRLVAIAVDRRDDPTANRRDQIEAKSRQNVHVHRRRLRRLLAAVSRLLHLHALRPQDFVLEVRATRLFGLLLVRHVERDGQPVDLLLDEQTIQGILSERHLLLLQTALVAQSDDVADGRPAGYLFVFEDGFGRERKESTFAGEPRLQDEESVATGDVVQLPQSSSAR